jgi:predicted  nucleic acid-binding Zn-ribbon protein
MADVHAAAELVRQIEGQILQNKDELERLAAGKRGHALASARGDKKATAAIAAANTAIEAADRRRADLVVALEEAGAELAVAKAAQQRVTDAALADLIEQRLTELTAARAAVDDAMQALAVALKAHHAASWQLRSVIPRPQESLAHGLGEALPVQLALRHHRLAGLLGWSPDASGGRPLSSLSTASIAQFVSSLRRALPRAA